MAGHSKWSDIKCQKGLTESRDRARQVSLRMIARGERPLYRPRVEPDGDFLFIRIPELDIATQARHRGEVVTMARNSIAIWLGVDAESFDVEFDARRDT
jgi:hypothetical protein